MLPNRFRGSGAEDIPLEQADLQGKMRTLSLDTAGTKEALIGRVLELRAQAPEPATEVTPRRKDGFTNCSVL